MPEIKDIVRRLTPRECAVLQGFPQDWCDGVPHGDGSEYILWGNGIALPCVIPIIKAISSRVSGDMLTVGNLFSGSGAWELASKICKVPTVFESEIEKFPVELEMVRFPDCIQLGDVNNINGYDIPKCGILTNSSPCQDISIASRNRVGLNGSRSGLFTQSIRITKEMREVDRLAGRENEFIRPRFWCWENVPGVLSSSDGEDFRRVISEIAGIVECCHDVPAPGRWNKAGVVDGDSWQIAWRVLDSKYFGVPQSRKRLFVVSDFAGHSAAEILFEREDISWDFKEIFEAWEDTSKSIEERIDKAIRIVSG